MEKVNSLPALIRLDGMKHLNGNELYDLKKLDLAFMKLKKTLTKVTKPNNLAIGPQPHRVILNIQNGKCDIHGTTKRMKSSLVLPDQRDEYCELKPSTNDDKRTFTRDVEFYEKHLYEVERMPKVTPFIEVPLIKSPKKKKDKTKKKANKAKGKGKGKKKGKKK